MKIIEKSAKYSVVAVIILLAAYLAVVIHLERQRPVRVPILMYHKVGTEGRDKWWVQPDEFEKHIRFLHEAGYASILPSDLVANRKWGKPLPGKPVILTFDDGYYNALTVVEPVLAQYGFKGIVYLVTGTLADTPDTRKTFHGAECLIWPEIREMNERGVLSFGGHTVNHRNLALASDPREQIEGCYVDILNKGGFAPDSFCYPYGQYRTETLDAVGRSKFTTAMTCLDEPAVIDSKTRLLELPRVSVMGGIHDYRINLQERVNGRIVVSAENKGTSVPATPALVVKNGGTSERLWQESVTPGPVPVVVTWLSDMIKPDSELIIELWDNNKILKLHETSL